jgi:[acyl-carrier-protein] S-malonyltransferase
MAAALLDREPAARGLFQRAGEVLGLDLAEACTRGSDALLTATDITQPALLTTCLAWLEVLKERGLVPQLVAGHSLGEFSAWVAAGALGFEEALRLVRRRGELMEEAGRRRPGGMLALIGLPDPKVHELCEQVKGEEVLVLANFNCPGQVVASGEERALERLAKAVEEAQGQALPLRVSGAFHSPLMEEAARTFAGLVSELALQAPRIPVVANASGEPVVEAEGAREAISRQMTSPVLWAASVRRMIADGAEVFVEVGPGRVLTGLIRRISSDVPAHPAGTPEQVETLLEELGR